MTDLPHAAPGARIVPTPPAEVLDAALNPEAANAAAEAVLANQTAEIIFAPPDSTQLRLPTGLLLGDQLYQDVEIHELTGADEEMMAREMKGRDYFMSQHFLDLILKAAVVEIGGHKPDRGMLGKLLIGDRQYLGLAIRRLTYGEWWEVHDFMCRLCGKPFEVAISMDCPGEDIGLKKLENPRDQTVTVDLKRGQARVRFASGADELAYLGDGNLSNAEQVSVLISRCLLSVAGQVPPPTFTRNLSASDRKEIVKVLSENAPGPRLGEVSVPCSNCNRSADYALNMVDLFLR